MAAARFHLYVSLVCSRHVAQPIGVRSASIVNVQSGRASLRSRTQSSASGPLNGPQASETPFGEISTTTYWTALISPSLD